MDGKCCSSGSTKVENFEVEFEKMKLKFQQMSQNLIEMEATLAHVKDDCKNCSTCNEKKARIEIEKEDIIAESVEPPGNLQASEHEQAKTEVPVEENKVLADRLGTKSSPFGCTDTREKTSLDSFSEFEKRWAALINTEMELEKKALLRKAIKHISAVSYEQHEEKLRKVFVKLPVGYTGVRPTTDDSITLVCKGWTLFGKIGSCSGFKNIYVTIIPKPNSYPAPPECDSFTLYYIINDHDY